MAEDFEDFVQAQHPLRPSGHPDWERLRAVVEQLEEVKANGTPPEGFYANLFDTYSVAYLAVNRCGMNPPGSYHPLAVQEQQTNAWVEGFLFGVLFQKAGGGIIQDQEPPA